MSRKFDLSFSYSNYLLVLVIDVKFKTIEGGKYVLPNEFRDSDILSDLDIIVTATNMVSFLQLFFLF